MAATFPTHTDQTMTIAGTVTEWEFINPHPQIYFDVKTETGADRALGGRGAADTLDDEEHEGRLDSHDTQAGRSNRAGLQSVASCGRESVSGKGA